MRYWRFGCICFFAEQMAEEQGCYRMSLYPSINRMAAWLNSKLAGEEVAYVANARKLDKCRAMSVCARCHDVGIFAAGAGATATLEDTAIDEMAVRASDGASGTGRPRNGQSASQPSPAQTSITRRSSGRSAKSRPT